MSDILQRLRERLTYEERSELVEWFDRYFYLRYHGDEDAEERAMTDALAAFRASVDIEQAAHELCAGWSASDAEAWLVGIGVAATEIVVYTHAAVPSRVKMPQRFLGYAVRVVRSGRFVVGPVR